MTGGVGTPWNRNSARNAAANSLKTIKVHGVMRTKPKECAELGKLD
jgi:hypothetical protein